MKPIRYEIVQTADGSPTFRDLESQNLETMHHSGGAYQETQLIYGNAVRFALSCGSRSFLSVGLGLGYNEILIAHECLKNEINFDKVNMLTFESEMQLKEDFLSWLRGDGQGIYNQVCGFFSSPPQAIRNWLLQAFESQSWILEGALKSGFDGDSENRFSNNLKSNCIFYDAFSSKTSPDLWTEDYLNRFLGQFAAKECIFSTYACTGSLKRSLKTNSFQLFLLPGFGGKRLRTTAIRGWELKDGHPPL